MDSNTIILAGKGSFIQHTRDFKTVEDRHNLVNKDQLINIFRVILDINISINNISEIKIGMGSAVFKVQTENYIYAVKIFLFQDTHNPLQEYLFNSIIQKSILIQNKIIVFDFSKRYLPYPYIISYWINGNSLFELSMANNNITELYMIFSQIGEIIKIIHEKCNQNTIRQELFVLKKNHEFPNNWYSIIKHNTNGQVFLNTEVYKAYILKSDLQRIIEQIDYNKVLRLINNIDLTILTCGYLHGDLSLLNFYFKDQKLVGILDGGLKLGYHYEELVNFYVFLYNIKFFNNACNIDDLYNAFTNSYMCCDKNSFKERNIFSFFLIYKVLSRLTTIFKVKRFAEYEFYRKFLIDQIKEIEILPSNRY